MPQTAYNELANDVVPIVKGAPLPTIVRKAQQAARDFYKGSRAYKFTVSQTLSAGTNSITLTGLDSETELYVPLTMYADGVLLHTTTEAILAAELENWQTESGTPKKLFRSAANVLTFDRNPTEDAAITGSVAVIPIRLAAGVMDTQFDEHADHLAAGTIAKLLEMRGTTWYDPALAGYYAGVFAAGVDEAKGEADNTNTSRILTTGYGGI